MDFPSSGTLLDRVLDDLYANERAAIGRLFDWLRIPSISTQDSHAPDCQRAAEWFRDQLRGLGFAAECPSDGRTPGRGRPFDRGGAGRARHPLPRPLRRAAGRPAGAVDLATLWNRR